MKRRDFLVTASAIIGTPFLIIRASGATSFTKGVGFPYSVASGDPTSDAVVLWTRLGKEAHDPSPVSPHAIDVEWMIALDPGMKKVVRRGLATARPELGHSVHVDVTGLSANHEYWYAFRCGSESSPVGRTRTLPAADQPLSRFCFNVVSCQNWEQGYFDAYDGMAADDAAFVMHLGDYIYEVSRGGGVRTHETNAFPRTLDDYRRRHALYKTDPALRRAHERYPFIVTLDNHDALYDNTTNPDELRRRAAAYQAWYEFQPVRYAPAYQSSAMTIQRAFDIGNLLRITMPDTRQYRDTETPCAGTSDKSFAFGNYEKACAESEAIERSMLGPVQEAWLAERLRTSTSRWNVIASTVKMSPFDMKHNGDLYRYMQSWDGYPAERERILDQIAEARLRNVVSLSGDIHSYLFSSVVRKAGDDPASALMTELVGTSISSVWPEPLAQPMVEALPANPHVSHFDYAHRGYMRCTFTDDELRTDLRTISTALTPGGVTATTGSFVVTNGRVGVQQA